MSDGAQRGTTRLHGALGEAFGEGWRRRVADDQHEPALEQLAAFADERLTPREEAQVAQEIAASPAALEILSSLVGDAELWRRLPLDGAESAADAPIATLRMPTPKVPARQQRTKQVAAWALAASVMIAAAGIVINQRGGQEVAQVDERDRADRATAALIVSGKTQVAQLEQSGQMPYIVGRSSAQWAALADQTVARTLAGGVRGGSDMTDEDAAAIGRAKDDLLATAQEFMLSGLPGRIEYAAALIQAGRLDDAHQVLDEIQAAASDDEASLAQWRNLRGSLLAKQAADAPMTEAEPLLAEAEELFRQAAEGGVDDAWLNLAMVLVEQGKNAEAEEARGKYRAGAAVDPAGE